MRAAVAKGEVECADCRRCAHAQASSPLGLAYALEHASAGVCDGSQPTCPRRAPLVSRAARPTLELDLDDDDWSS